MNQPIYRFGRVASNGFRVVDGQESILVEARSIDGLSGAPVLVGLHNFYARPGVTVPYESRTWLLGVQWGYVHDWTPVYLGSRPQENQRVRLNTGIMCIVPAWHLTELLQSERAAEFRRLSDELGLKSGMALKAV